MIVFEDFMRYGNDECYAYFSPASLASHIINYIDMVGFDSEINTDGYEVEVLSCDGEHTPLIITIYDFYDYYETPKAVQIKHSATKATATVLVHKNANYNRAKAIAKLIECVLRAVKRRSN